jgi:hypothetical protein
MRKALASLPWTLNKTYQRMIANIPVELKKDAIRLLQFLVHSKQPLTLAETKEVIATQIENEPQGFDIKHRLFCETDVLDYCPGLITVVHAAKNVVHLAHFSVKECLSELNDFNNMTASISITRTCLTYLTDINSSRGELKQEFPMTRYAAEVWTGHAALAQGVPDVVRLIVRFLTEEETFQRWARLYQADRSWDINPGPPRGSRLYYACLAGLLAPVQDLINDRADVNTKGGECGNALQAASSEGYQVTIRLLLDKGADINMQGGYYGNTLQAALLEGYQEIIRLLLDKGADINAQGGEHGNALSAALSNSY